MKYVKIENDAGYRKVIAIAAISANSVIYDSSACKIQTERTPHTIQIGYRRHLLTAGLPSYVNYSCEPNTIFDPDRRAYVALTGIARGEEMTFFYPGAEIEMIQDFDCHCGAAECIGRIRGGFYLTPAQMANALQRGLCTAFMARQFRRLLGVI